MTKSVYGWIIAGVGSFTLLTGCTSIASVSEAMRKDSGDADLATWKDNRETDLATGTPYSYRSLENSDTKIFITSESSGEWVKIYPSTSSRVKTWQFSSITGGCPVRLRIEGEEAFSLDGICSTDSGNYITLMSGYVPSFIAAMQRGAGKKAYISFVTYDGDITEEVPLPKAYPK